MDPAVQLLMPPVGKKSELASSNVPSAISSLLVLAKLNRIIQSTKHFSKNVQFVMYLKINVLQSLFDCFFDCKSYYLIDISLYLIIVVNPSNISIK